MRDSNIPGTELLRNVLQPLLEDFQYWFARSPELSEQLSFKSQMEQSDLLKRVKQAQHGVKRASMLFSATEGKVGLDMGTLMPWHQLVTECWSVAMRFGSQGEG